MGEQHAEGGRRGDAAGVVPAGGGVGRRSRLIADDMPAGGGGAFARPGHARAGKLFEVFADGHGVSFPPRLAETPRAAASGCGDADTHVWQRALEDRNPLYPRGCRPAWGPDRGSGGSTAGETYITAARWGQAAGGVTS